MGGYIPNTNADKAEMLAALGIQSVDELFGYIPEDVRLDREPDLPGPLSELELMAHMKRLAGENASTGQYACFLGAGVYDHYIPSLVSHVLSRQEFYTSYTPYQPEISQGMLQAIFEYQTMICEITGMDVTNASMYDGATAVAEAAFIAVNSTKRNEVLVSQSVHPEYRKVLATYARFRGVKVREIGLKDGVTAMEELEDMLTGDTAAVIVQSPNFFGLIEDMKEIPELAHRAGALAIACVDPISLGMLKPPGEYGFDIAVGDGQALGNPMSYGGPHLGFLAVVKDLMRKMPGRIVGQTNDQEGRRGFVLTLQAREQHIRREKAVSNICSNHALNALAAAVYLTVLGKEGLREVAAQCMQKAHYACDRLVATGRFERAFSGPYFKEFVLKSSEPVKEINKRLLENKIIGGLDLGALYPDMNNCWLTAVTEKRTGREIDKMAGIAAGEQPAKTGGEYPDAGYGVDI